MNPMTKLLIATAAFLATHYISSTPLRSWLTRALGTNGYLMLYSAVAFATLGGMAWAYYHAPFLGWWHVPALRYVPLFVMPLAMILIICGLMTRNPTLVGSERLLRSTEPAQGILRITRQNPSCGLSPRLALFPKKPRSPGILRSRIRGLVSGTLKPKLLKHATK